MNESFICHLAATFHLTRLTVHTWSLLPIV